VPFLKQRVVPILKRAGLYERLRTSSIHDLYRRIADEEWLFARARSMAFYRNLLPGFSHGDLIFDVGANQGMKTDLFLRMGARVIAVEPDERNQAILQERFLKLRASRKPVVIVGKAVSDSDGVESMWIDGPGSAVNTLSQKWAAALKGNKVRHTCGHCGLDFDKNRTIETTTLENLIALFGRPKFIKIDIEGYELNAIRGLRQPISCLSFEVNLPEFLPEGLACVERLTTLATTSEFNYSADCERGLALQRWVSPDEFSAVLRCCNETSIEVFCRT